MNDNQYPWLILVPRRANITEIYQLAETDQQQLLRESYLIAKQLTTIYQPDKLNIAAIGNLVPQLHLHHVARYQHDIAWPAPIWGKFPAQAYAEQDARRHIDRLRASLGEWLIH